MLDFSKPIRTRDGQAVRILCVDANCKTGDIVQPIVGIVANGVLAAWGENGAYMPGRDSPLDLVNVPSKKAKVVVEVRLVRLPNGLISSRCMFDGEKFINGASISWDDLILGDEQVLGTTAQVELEYEVQP